MIEGSTSCLSLSTLRQGRHEVVSIGYVEPSSQSSWRRAYLHMDAPSFRAFATIDTTRLLLEEGSFACHALTVAGCEHVDVSIVDFSP